MPLSPETITSLQEKAAAEERAIQLAKEALKMAEATELAARRAQFEAEEADELRINALRKEMEDINTQIKADGHSQEGLRISIEENPGKTKYETENQTFTGLTIARTYLRAVVLTPEGIKTFGIGRRINLPASGLIPIFSAKDMKLDDYDLKYLLPRAEFPSVGALSQKIKALLDI